MSNKDYFTIKEAEKVVDKIFSKEVVAKNFRHVTRFNRDYTDVFENVKNVKVENDLINLLMQESQDEDLVIGFNRLSNSSFSVVRHKDFMYVSITLWSKMDRMFHVSALYSSIDFETLFEEEIREKIAVQAKRTYDIGLYNIKKNLQGCYLFPIKTSEIEEPILNDNLADVLRQEINGFINMRNVYVKNKLEYKRGILMYGLPGNGKTSFLKSFFHKFSAITIFVNVNDYEEIEFLKTILSDENYKDILKVIVIEDIDGMSSSMRSEVLNLLDGVIKCEKTVFIGTTNYPSRLDNAIKKRPSRFDSLYHIDLPNPCARRKIFERYFGEFKDKKYLSRIVKDSDGLSGAFLKEVFLYSKLNGKDASQTIEILKERNKVIMGFVE